MSEKVVIQLETLTRLADGFRESRGIANNLTTEQMITLAQEPIKPEQEKTVDITENGTTEIMADEGYTLSRVVANVNVSASAENKVAQITNGTAIEITAEDLAGVTRIKQMFLSFMEGLERIEIPENVTEIGDSAFGYINEKSGEIVDIYYLSSAIPSLAYCQYRNTKFNLHLASQSAFNSYMEQFQEEGSIHQNSYPQTLFINNEVTTEVTVPSTVTVLENMMLAFDSNKLKSIIFLGNIATIYGYPFDYVSTTQTQETIIDFTHCTAVPNITNSKNVFGVGMTIKVPTALYDEWIATTNWANYAEYIVAV